METERRKMSPCLIVLIAVGVMAVLCIGLIGVMVVTVAAPNFRNAQVRAKAARVRSEHRSLVNALESFNIDNKQYPVQEPGKSDISFAGFETEVVPVVLRLTTPIAYVATIPVDPFRSQGGSHEYQYGSNGFSYYIITSYGPDGDSDFKEEFYTGAGRGSDTAAWRGAPLPLRDYRYDSSNGIRSGGDIIKTGP